MNCIWCGVECPPDLESGYDADGFCSEECEDSYWDRLDEEVREYDRRFPDEEEDT